MFKNYRRTAAFLFAASLMLTSFVGCGNADDASSSISLSSEEATEAPTDEPTDAPTELETEAPTEAPTDAPTEPETDAPTEAEETGEAVSNIELIRLINRAFGIMTDGTDDDEIAKAQSWDIIDTDLDIDYNAPVTKEFLVSSVVRATGFLDGKASQTDLIMCAVEKGIIESPDLSLVDASKAEDIVEKGKDAWIHQDFSSEISVVLCEGVLDLTDKISCSDYSINGNDITLPPEYSSEIKEGTVFILPKDPETGLGGAYKALVVNDAVGFTVINARPASIEEVYSSISSH